MYTGRLRCRNGEIKIRGFKQYVDMFLTSATEASAEAAGGAAVAKASIVYESSLDRWEYAFHVTFTNSVSMSKGGTHVRLVTDQICKSLITRVEKKNKAVKIKIPQIKNHIWIFVNALIENPTFDSQTKEQHTLPAVKFCSNPALTEAFLKSGESDFRVVPAKANGKVAKSGIAERVLNWQVRVRPIACQRQPQEAAKVLTWLFSLEIFDLRMLQTPRDG